MVAKLLVTAALFAANTALSMSRKIEGPRTETKFTSGDYGAGLDNVWGKRRTSPPIFWAEDLKEVKRRRKTKGGKYNEYSYYGSFGVALAGHEIEQVTRIWFDTHLVFDLTRAGPVTPFDFGDASASKPFAAAASGGQSWSSFMSIYTGTETQEPDPRMQATVEAEHGEGSCPAYRGTAYIVFKDVPLEKLGNRIPQVSVEFIGAGAAQSIITLDEEQPVITLWTIAKFSSDFSRILFATSNLITNETSFEIWDSAAHKPIIWGSLGEVELSNNSALGMFANGSFMAVGDLFQTLYLFSADGATKTVIDTWSLPYQDGVFVIADGSGVEHWMTYPIAPYTGFVMDAADNDLDFGTAPTHFFSDAYGDIWAVCRPWGASSQVSFIRVHDDGNGPGWPTSFALSGLPTATSPECFATHSRTADADVFILQRQGLRYLVDPSDGSWVAVPGASIGGATPYAIWSNIVPGSATVWQGGNEVSLITGEIVRTITGGLSVTRSVYDPISHAIIQDVTGSVLRWYYLDRVSSDGVTLGAIVANVCSRSGISPDQIDAAALTQTVPGYSTAGGSGKDWLDPLLDLFDSDARPHGFALEFIKRGGTSGGTLADSGFARSEGQAIYSASRGGPTDVPARVTLNFADVAADQQPNAAPSGPLAGATGKAETTLDMSTLALDVDAARQLVARYHRRALFDRTGYTLSLPAAQASLEPGDVRTLQLPTGNVLARLSSLVLTADRQIEARWKRDDPAVAVPGGQGGAPFDGRTPATIIVPLVSKGFVLDIPLLRDADSVTTPVVYLAAAPYVTGAWPGASFFQAIDGEYSEEIASVASSSQAAWGYATDVLADADPNVWDRGNAVNVKLQVGTLTGTTEAAINASPTTNLALIGNELVNFTTATLETDGSYTLSGLKRGRRGTEWATASHAERDVFLLLDTAETEAMGLSEVGTDLSFKAITSGRSESSAFPIDLSFTGASLKPYAPCHLRAELSGSDWVLGWTRRTRVGGAWTSGTSIPLSEAAEEYEIEIMDGATVKRTVTGLTSPAYTYLSADQTTDFGAPLTSAPSFRVYQISDAVGRGFVATA
jgi:hypothetical protein